WKEGDTVKEIEITWGRALKIWWSLVWRGVLFGMLGGAVVGFVVGALGVSPKDTTLIGMIIGVPIGIWVVKNVVGKSYSDFRLVLVSCADEINQEV
ncbi:MAG TPA: hypothetical protein VKA31_06450, partial [Mariprofundaceae bacterium]|nr:hypothetical protein [Mariprofundaceae bacterium]